MLLLQNTNSTQICNVFKEKKKKGNLETKGVFG